MRTPTLDRAGNLPSVHFSQGCCVAGEQIFDDSHSFRPSSLSSVASAEITLKTTILIYES